MDEQTQKTLIAIEKISAGIDELRAIYKHTKRQFSMDGRMVGDIGEVIAASGYDIILTEGLEKGHDGMWGTKKVQVKATYGNSGLGFSSAYKDMYYIGLQLLKEQNSKGQIYEEIYNGEGKAIYDFLCNEKVRKAPQKLKDMEDGKLISISLSDLKMISASQMDNRVPKKCSLSISAVSVVGK